ncbi:hypothetical protein BX600DRAFT_545968 [Xylariales sp. PMI_506]|nr:hypothetical protein BX600DRAFT_545968 [Xylariales sp. PMI_506]
MAQRVLLTGGNGFLGNHILSLLLKQGYSVRCVVRSETIAERMRTNFGADASVLDFSIVPDVQVESAYDAAVQSVPPIDYIVHVASPFWFRNNPTQKDFLLPAVKSTENLVASVAKYARQVKRFVMTSSCAAVIDFSRPLAEQPSKTYTADDWNPVTWAEAEAGHLGMAYQASKKFSELKLRESTEKLGTQDISLEVTTLCPPNIYGPVLFPESISSFAELNESNFGIYSDFIKSEPSASLPDDVVPWYVDVRDLASIHVRALTEPKAANQRILVPAAMASSQEVADILRNNLPELESRTPKGPQPGVSSVPAGGFTISQDKLNEILPTSFRSREETFIDLAKQLLAIERRTESASA